MTRLGHALLVRQLRLSRQGFSPDDCQDALAGDSGQGRFAVADGASESPHAALWARLLVEGFVHGKNKEMGFTAGQEPLSWNAWLPAVQQRWASAITPMAGAPALPWYLEPGMQQGAFATFLGLVFHPPGPWSDGLWQWETVAIGDSCLFHTRGDALLRAFPVSRSADFDNAPWLLGSRSPPRQGETYQGDAHSGDRFWLMTDALAQWFLAQVERGGKPWLRVEPLLQDTTNDRAFGEWIEQLRQARQLRNDDVALLAIGLE